MSLLKGLAGELVKRRLPVTPTQFKTVLEQKPARIVALDSSWFLNPKAQSGGKTGEELYRQERIPGARFFDVDGIKDGSSPYPHMLPDTNTFNRAMSRLGVERSDLLVVYDAIGNFSAPRAYWMLRAFQHERALILDNYPLYKRQGFEVDTAAPAKVDPSKYESPGVVPQMVVSYEQLREIAVDSDKLAAVNIIDARPAGRFHGSDPEPRPGLSSGHVPGAISVPFTSVLDPESKQFLPANELKQAFNQLDPFKPTIAMCGTGVTACVLETALRSAGYEGQIGVYDGSWTEWAQRAGDELIIKD